MLLAGRLLSGRLWVGMLLSGRLLFGNIARLGICRGWGYPYHMYIVVRCFHSFVWLGLLLGCVLRLGFTDALETGWRRLV